MPHPQDLSRLSVPVPYTSHIFEDSLQRGRSLHRHQTTAHDDTPPASMTRRSSTGSMSGYESESALVSQVSFQTSDTQAVLQLNFALPRYILMLDIWLSQVVNHSLNYSPTHSLSHSFTHSLILVSPSAQSRGRRCPSGVLSAPSIPWLHVGQGLEYLQHRPTHLSP